MGKYLPPLIHTAFLYFILSFCFYVVDTKLLYLSTTIRHGSRYPLSSNYDIYDSNQTKQFSGLLTTVGMRQTYLLGNYVQSDYIKKQKIVNQTLFTKEVEIFSSPSSRCIETAVAYSLGLFPFGKGSQLPANITQNYLKPPFNILDHKLKGGYKSEWALNRGFQPVPIFTTPYYFRCSREMEYVNKRFEEEKAKLQAFHLSQSEFIERLKRIFNLKPEYTTLLGLTDVFDLVVCDMYLGRKLPDQFEEKDFKQLQFIQAFLFSLVYSDKAGRVFATPIMSQVLGKMKSVIQKGENEVKRLTVFSGHDTNVVALLTSLNLTSADCLKKRFYNESFGGNCADVIPFASNIIFELHETDNESLSYYVRIKYNGQYFKLCESNLYECHFEEFSNRVKASLVDFQKQCPFQKLDQE